MASSLCDVMLFNAKVLYHLPSSQLTPGVCIPNLRNTGVDKTAFNCSKICLDLNPGSDIFLTLGISKNEVIITRKTTTCKVRSL